MYLKVIAATACWALISTAAIAEDATASSKGEWQASKLIRMNVYNGQNEKIGDIKELMLDKSGKVADVVIGVGGFLGAGEHDVAIKFDQLKWSNDSSTTGSGHDEVGRGDAARIRFGDGACVAWCIAFVEQDRQHG